MKQSQFVLQKGIEKGIITLPHAIQLATSAPERVVPGVAPNRGLVEIGKIADVCIVDRQDISNVKHVIIGGRLIVEEGRVAGVHPLTSFCRRSEYLRSILQSHIKTTGTRTLPLISHLHNPSP